MNLHKVLFTGLIALFLSAMSGVAQRHKYDTWDENYTVQALLGAVKYDDLKFNNVDGGDRTEIDISMIPQLGGAWTTLPRGGGAFQYGLESSLLLGFRLDRINYAYLGGGGAYVSISTSMWMFDLAGGGYANLWITDNIRLYSGAGPLIMYADYRSDRDYDSDAPDEDVSEHESAFGIGLYARTGIEFRLHERSCLGIGARGNWSSIDLSDVGGTSDISGTAAFVTYTAGF